MAKVKWGVLGCAAFAKNRTIPALLQAPSVDLVGVASRALEKAEAFRQQFGLARAYGSYEEMVEDPSIQALYIPLSNDLHAPWMIRAAEHGKHSISEKPFSLNAQEADAVAATSRRTGMKMMEAFMWRFHPQHERARDLIRAGAVGPVRLVRASFTFKMGRGPNFRWDPQFGGGSLMDVGCYPISAARYYFGSEPTRVYAHGSIDPETGIDMSMAGVLQFEQGEALVDGGFHLPGRSEIEIAGDEGVIRIPAPWLPGEQAFLEVRGQTETLPAANQYVNQFEQFSLAILNNTPPPYDADDAVRQMRAMDAVVRSMRTGEAAAIPSA